MAKRSPSPRDLLLSYQARWSNDASRWKIGLMSRQVGKDFTSADEGTEDIIQRELLKQKTDWIIAAPSERQSLESLEKWKEWTTAKKMAIADIGLERMGDSESLLKSASITFRHGSRVIAVPGKPDTVRGYSANILLTEFAFFEDPDRTWRAILPSVTNPLRGGEKKVRLISTPNGQGNKFHDLWIKNYQVPGSKWSCHRVDVYDAVKAGLPINIAELREAIDDPEGWAQEFECEFMDVASVLLPYELIAACENPNATAAAPDGFWASSAAGVYLGIDFGRKRDRTVCWALQNAGGSGYGLTREVLCLDKTPTPRQLEILTPRIERAARVAFDYTGPGIGLGDYLVERFGQWDPQAHQYGKIELCTATAESNREDFPRLRQAFEHAQLGIPAIREIREDLHSVYRVVTPAGNIAYRAPHSADGHADRAHALNLAWRAMQAPAYAGTMKAFTQGRRGQAVLNRRERTVTA
jgi:phage FluMu gp28-like protein